MTKTIMSVVALATILGTGAQAFDTNTTGDLLTRTGTPGNYKDGTPSHPVLSLSTNAMGDRLKGDAVIYPAFDMQNGWGNEITVRNELPGNLSNHKNSQYSDRAVVAKVVLYAADDSRELIDFNIYLSQDDQFKFTIKDGVVKSTDGSVVISESFANDDATFASDDKPFEVKVVDPITKKVVETGYVVIYGMMQTPRGYHKDHKNLFKAYRSALDDERDGWRTAHMTLGVYDDVKIEMPAPNTDQGHNYQDVDHLALSGTSRLYNASGETRDLLLNATALHNFTSGNVVIWAPGEYAAIADRKIENGKYMTDEFDGVPGDSYAFLVNSTTYAYNNENGNVDNKWLFTQPTKRFMVQLGFGSKYWVQACKDDSADAKNIETGLEWGFRGQLAIYDEDENEYSSTVGGGIITSPASSVSQGAHCNELTTLGTEDLEGQAPEFANGNGFIDFTLNTGQKHGMPAIVTQMSANRVGANGETNWVYSPATKNNK